MKNFDPFYTYIKITYPSYQVERFIKRNKRFKATSGGAVVRFGRNGLTYVT